jgi:Fur family transcriptional regulator, peroxide stress response regulator
MPMNSAEIIDKLKQKKMRVTPQRVAVFQAVCQLNNHPTAENIISNIKHNHPYISVGTVYKVLDSLVENHLLEKVKTENGTMRYDPILSKHHHLYCEETDRIEDYEDHELDKMIEAYFRNKKIKNFKIIDIKLQITGKFKNQ